MAIAFLTGQRLTADLLNANINDYMPSTTAKAVATARLSTVTLADDAELAGIPLGVGTWEIEFIGLWTQTTTATQKIKTRWAFTGTWNGSAGFRAALGAGDTQSAVAVPNNLTEVNARGYTLDTQDAVYHVINTTSYSTIREISRNVVVTVAGNMSIQWAQNTSVANNTTLQAGSSVTVRKL
jgi:hypothetical protein